MPRLIFPTKDEAPSVQRAARKGDLHKIRNGIYIDAHEPEEIAETLNRKWMDVACRIFASPVAVARTAVELRPAAGKIYLVSDQIKAPRTVLVGHLHFAISPGNAEQGVEQVTLRLRRSQPARYLLENLAESRGPDAKRKTLGSEWVETELTKIIRLRGEQALNTTRDDARRLAPLLGLDAEFEILNKQISAILKTHPVEGILQTRLGIATARGEPYDELRIERFKGLAEYLRVTSLDENGYTYAKSAWRNLTFFESYFSNFIEGTEFTLEEAEKIAFEKTVIYERHEDSHDILAHIEISGDVSEMHRTPSSAADLLDLLKVRHGVLLAERPDKNPGKFKERANRAGGTDFVLPGFVEGTIAQGFEIYQSLQTPLHRAIFMHFLVAEVHPFDDGNGRIARIMMNAELVANGQYKIIIPIVHRDSYLESLRLASRQNRFRAMVKVLHQMQCYSASISWSDYGDAKSQLQGDAADKAPDEGLSIFNRAIASLGGTYPPG